MLSYALNAVLRITESVTAVNVQMLHFTGQIINGRKKLYPDSPETKSQDFRYAVRNAELFRNPN